MIEDLGIEDLDENEIVPLANVNAAILKKIIDWCTHYKNDDSKIGLCSIDLLSHFTKVKCDSWTWFFCVVLVTQEIPATLWGSSAPGLE
jgi:hypothetical protein